MSHSFPTALINTIPFDDFRFPFVDQFAQFAVTFPAASPLGVGILHPRAVLSTYHLCDYVSQIWIEEDGIWSALRRTRLTSLPWMAQETATAWTDSGEIRIEAQHVYADGERLVSEFSFINTGSKTSSLNFGWFGKLNSDYATYMGSYYHGAANAPRKPTLNATGSTIIGGLDGTASNTDLASVAFRLSTQQAGLTAQCSAEPLWMSPTAQTQDPRFYGIRPEQPLCLEPGESVQYTFTLDLAIADGTATPEFSHSPQLEESFDTLKNRSEKRFLENIAADKPPAAPSPHLQAHAWRARYALLRDGLEGNNGEFGEHIASLCSSDTSDFSCSFFWDTLFSSVALSDFHPKAARGAIITCFNRHDPKDGSTPERKFNHAPPYRMAQQHPQSPVASWAVARYLRKHPDPAFLKTIYPTLKRNHTFWEKHSDGDGDGLAEYRWSGQIADNSPLWDAFFSQADGHSGCAWVPPVAAVSLNCFLYKDAHILEQLARLNGEDADAAYFAQRKERIFKAFHEICYHENDGVYYDYFHQTGRHIKTKTFYLFWPLFAGLPIAEEVRKRLIEKHLLNPDEFFGAVPFPSVAYNEPTYDANGYWRGKSWPHITYWLLETLVEHGYEKQAEEAARRILAWSSSRPGFLENTCSDLRRDDPLYLPKPGSKCDYNWGCASFYLIATEAWRHPLDPTTLSF